MRWFQRSGPFKQKPEVATAVAAALIVLTNIIIISHHCFVPLLVISDSHTVLQWLHTRHQNHLRPQNALLMSVSNIFESTWCWSWFHVVVVFCSLARCECVRRAGQVPVLTCSALMLQLFSRWTRKSRHGCVRYVINRQSFIALLLTGETLADLTRQ